MSKLLLGRDQTPKNQKEILSGISAISHYRASSTRGGTHEGLRTEICWTLVPTGSTSFTADVRELGEQTGGLLQAWYAKLIVVVAVPPVKTFVAVTLVDTVVVSALLPPSRRQISPVVSSTVTSLKEKLLNWFQRKNSLVLLSDTWHKSFFF